MRAESPRSVLSSTFGLDGHIVKQRVQEFVASAKPVADTIDDMLGQLARIGLVERGTMARATVTGKAYEGALLGKNEPIAELRRRVLSGHLPRRQVWDNLAATAELMGLSEDEELEAIPSAARAVLGGSSG